MTAVSAGKAHRSTFGHFIPLTVPELDRATLVHAASVADLAAPSTLGPATVRVERMLAAGFGAAVAHLTTGATTALEVLAIALRARGYRRAIVPSFTHVSSASAFALHGYQVEFVDVDDQLLIDARSVEATGVDAETVVLAVHYGGQHGDLRAVEAICQAAGALLVEDFAHSFSSRFAVPSVRPAGAAAIVSFQLYKEITCGEGGALLLFDADLDETVRTIRDRGTNRRDFEAGAADTYTWVSQGSSFAPSELTATVLEAHLERRSSIIQPRRHVLRRYCHELSSWADLVGARLPEQALDAGAANTAYVQVGDESERRSLASHLDLHGIGSAFHFPPLHRSPMARHLGTPADGCPGSDRAFAGLLRLPLHTSLTDLQVDAIIEAVASWR